MKKIAYNLILTSVLGLIILLSTIRINAQNNKEKNLEGIIYLRTSKNISLNFYENEITKSPSDIYFLKNLVDKYRIVIAEFPFRSTNNDKLQRTFRIKYNNIENSNLLISELKQLKELELVEKAPNYQTVVNTNDPYYNKAVSGTHNGNNLGNTNSSWYLNIIQAEQAWDITEGSATTIVAVLDNAFLTSHEDLANKFYSQIDLSDLNNIDNDVEPIVNTYEWSHGTLMAGIIAAESNNGLGAASIGRNINLMAIKLASDLSPDYQSIVNIPEAIVYAVDNGAKVINISLATTTWSETLLEAVNYALNNAVVIVAAAGNDNSTNLYYPAAMNGVISVGSTNFDDSRSSFSNHGNWIDIYAPGGSSNQGFSGIGTFSILSSSANIPTTIADVIVGTTGGASSYIIDETSNAISGQYDLVSGTSASAAITSGVCGLLLSLNPNLTPIQIKEILKNSADTISEGLLRINAFKAVNMVNEFPADTMLISFKASQTAIDIQDSVSFSILLPNPIESNDVLEWTFENGIPKTSNIENPTIKYFDRGRFDVTLKITKKDFDNPIIDTSYKIIVDSVYHMDTTWGTDVITGELEVIDIIRITDTVYRDTLVRVDTTYNILKESETKITDLIIVGKQMENEIDMPKSVLREQVSNLPNGYTITKIDPVSEDIVWALASDGIGYKLLKTNNYGTKWDTILPNINNLDTIYDISATSYSDIWLLAKTDTSTIKMIYYSNDGALTWTTNKVLDTLVTTNKIIYDFNKLKMIDNSTGYATGYYEEIDNGVSTLSYVIFETQDSWNNIINAITLEPNESVSSNIIYRNNTLICGSNKGKIYKKIVPDGTSNSSLIATDSSAIITLSFAYANDNNNGVITQALALVEENDMMKVYKSTDLSTWTTMSTNSFGNGLLKEMMLQPTDSSLLAANINATEMVALVEDTIVVPSKIKLYYTRNNGLAWQIVDSTTRYSTLALYDYHKGWFGSEISDFSSGIYKWFDVPEIISNNVTLYERDTLGFYVDDFTRTPYHYRVETIDPDNHSTYLAPITSIPIFLFKHDDVNTQSSGELSGLVTIAVTNPNGNVYYSNIIANNGVRYSRKVDTISIKTLRVAPVFIYENGDTIFSLQIDTTITAHQAFELTIRVIDTDIDKWHAKKGIIGEDIKFEHDGSLPISSSGINGGVQYFSWLSFVNNNDTTANYKTAKLYGTTEKIGFYQIKIRCSDGMFNILPATAQYLYINITVVEKDMGVDENEIENFQIYPNPANNYISINNANGLKYEIMDITGKIIDSNILTNSAIDISTYNTGNYMIKIYGEKQVSVQKFIKY